MTNLVPIRRALISVSDKTGIVQFAQQLREWNVEIISTGGTLNTLTEAGITAKSVSDITGFPEILDGRVKTLHPKIHAGLLAIASEPSHRQQLSELAIEPIDMVVVNLYPFEQTIAQKNIALDDAVEQIDIGGPTMIRAAAKNFRSKTVIVNPGQYQHIIAEMKSYNGSVTEETRYRLAGEVFTHTARYDSMISNYLRRTANDESSQKLPETFSITLPKAEDLRYGENSHQQAALYGSFHSYFEKLHGKELSFNNISDIQAAAELLEEFSEPTVVIIKHTNPCGAGSGVTLADAYSKAFATDTKSAFGGIVAVNRALDMTTAQAIDAVFTEVIIAPSYADGVPDFLKKKKDRRSIQQLRALSSSHGLQIKSVTGGVLVQTFDDAMVTDDQLRVVTKRVPTKSEHESMMFAWKVAKHVRSNAIVYARADRTMGIGAGQMSRFDSSRIAVLKAQEAGLDLHGTAVASDAFFPFADGLLEAVKAGSTAVIQPGGSVRDNEVIEAANSNNITMFFTGMRHFKH